jgi:hypothetical protein
MGMSTLWLFTMPTVKPVSPAMAPCTTPEARVWQRYESSLLAGTDRMV